LARPELNLSAVHNGFCGVQNGTLAGFPLSAMYLLEHSFVAGFPR
jgi:hypothetical protein